MVKESVAKRLWEEINARRNPPWLQGVTGAPLGILRMLWAEVGVRNDHIRKQWLPVVPESYLSPDILLECDVLGQAPLTWDGKWRVMVWGNTPYVVNHIPRQRNKVEWVKLDPVDVSKPSQSFPQINLLHPEKLPLIKHALCQSLLNKNQAPHYWSTHYPDSVKVVTYFLSR